jgi:hypothetical protein
MLGRIYMIQIDMGVNQILKGAVFLKSPLKLHVHGKKVKLSCITGREGP